MNDTFYTETRLVLRMEKEGHSTVFIATPTEQSSEVNRNLDSECGLYAIGIVHTDVAGCVAELTSILQNRADFIASAALEEHDRISEISEMSSRGENDA